MDDDMDEAADDDDDESHSEDEEGDDHDMDADTASLYAALRIYTGYDGADHSANLLRTNSILLPLQQRLDGFFGYIVTYDGAETLAAVSIFDSEGERAESQRRGSCVHRRVLRGHPARWSHDGDGQPGHRRFGGDRGRREPDRP